MTLAETLDAATKQFAPDKSRATATLVFSGGEFFFDGHFPGVPVLPAIVQIGLAVHFAARLAGKSLNLAEVTRAVFIKPVGPGVELDLVVELLPAEAGLTRVKAELTQAGARISEFSLRVQ
ncbi:MAG: hypothetical protein IT462_09945 [Planctomycetes bacterium]|nr:hypothetical protein [Planctomycetota bacterium]